MRLAATHPPPPDVVARYRSTGRWRAGVSRAVHLAGIKAGGARIALVDDASRWTHAQLATAVDEVDQSLAAGGVTSEDAVLIVTPLRNAAAAAFVGTVLHGAVAVMLDRRCGESDVANAIRAAGPRVAMAFDEDAERLGLARHCEVVSLNGIGTGTEPTSPWFADNDVDPDAPAAVLFTSGTTSKPKGVVHTINSLRCGSDNMIAALDIGADDALFLSSPLASITGVLQLSSVLTTQAKLILDDRFSPERALERVCEHRATLMGGAPFLAQTVLDEAVRQDRPLPLRRIAVGGSMVPPSIIQKASAVGIRTVRVYGSSEAPFSTATSAGSELKPSDDGVPMPGVEVDLLGPHDELLVRGPHRFHGYLDPTDNIDAFYDGWIRTGDQADIGVRGIRIKGRLKEIVVRKGMKISLSEIDSAAAELGECSAFAVPDHTTGERLALAVRVTDSRDITYPQVVELLMSAGLARWKLPEQIVVWDGPLPRTATGKVDRRELSDERRHRRTLFAPRLTESPRRGMQRPS